ncbi:MAG: DUF1638 domain-containing protein [Desulfobacterales bacterium]|jgi:hypothetical protein|nr:DUF1638 domain-containing protein [Desulfobacterales bacterium]
MPPDVQVIACRALAPELRAFGVPPERLRLLDQGLHRCPQILREELARTLGEVESQPGVSRVVLVYGYCGGGLEGLAPHKAELVLPIVHDCIPLLLGPDGEPGAADAGGTYYLSPGLIDYGQTPYTEFQRIRERFGDEEALWAVKEMIKNYREVILIRTAAGLKRSHRLHARRMAHLLGLAYREAPGDGRLLADLLAGRCREGILRLKPGEAMSASRLKRSPV